ncbi:MAG TPA: hypothetical protein GXX18_14420 [Bacillales bacterium]|nr:hypothetical protein [Bacillales bacterium]
MNFLSKAIPLNIWGVLGVLFGIYLIYLVIKNPPKERYKKKLLWFVIEDVQKVISKPPTNPMDNFDCSQKWK